MTAVSDMFPAAEAGGRPAGMPLVVPPPARDGHPGARARVAVTERSRKVGALIDGVRSDVASAWPLHDSPPALSEMWAERIPDVEDVPGQSRILQVGWAVYNHAVAIPLSAVGYLLLWLLQHPARAALTAVILVPIIIAIVTATG